VLDTYLLFRPRHHQDGSSTPTAVGLQYDDVFLASDGVQGRLHGWFVPAKSDITLLWFHGSGSDISQHLGGIEALHHELGVNLFIFDYRGYGHSDGTVTEDGTYRDAEAALRYLLARQDVNPTGIVFYGCSLGSGVAVEMATRHAAYAVLLESPFTNIKAAAMKRYSWLLSWFPIGAIVQSRYDSLAKIKNVHSPLMIVHGDRDEEVPIDLGRQLFEAGNEPKEFYAVTGAGHNDTYSVGGKSYYRQLRRFLASCAGHHGQGRSANYKVPGSV